MSTVENEEDCRNVERLDVNLRVFNNDLVGFSITSQSTRKNWIVVGLLIMVVLAVTVKALWPIVEKLGIV